MWQLVLAYISVQGWVIDPYVNGFFDGSFHVLFFSSHNAKIVVLVYTTKAAPKGVALVVLDKTE